MRTRLSIGAVLVATAAAGCAPPGRMNGTITGAALDVNTVIFLYQTVQGGSSPVSGLIIYLTNERGLCTSLREGFWPSQAETLELSTYSLDSSGQPLPPAVGTYAVVPWGTKSAGDLANVQFTLPDRLCSGRPGADGAGVSGTVSVSEHTERASVQGSFDVLVGDQRDHVTGSFDATFCDAPCADGTCS